MEFTFTPLRVAILIVLLAGFWFAGGFTPPDLSMRTTDRIWLCSIISFVVGAVMVSVVDHWVGNLDRSNLRWLYVVMGVLAMSGSGMYRHVLNERVKMELPQSED
jgi:hypothetical protein